MPTVALYGGEVALDFDPERHIYRANGKKIDSVTGVLGIISKPALIPWAVKMAVEHIAERLKPGVPLDEVQIKDLLKAAKAAHIVKKEHAADVGTFVHEWIEQFVKGGGTVQPMPLHPQVKNGVDAFLRWVSENRVEFHCSELKVCSREWEYAGTLDFEATVNGKRMLGDIKTSSGIYEEMFLQTSAYQIARQEEDPSLAYEGHIIVNCRKDGTLDTRVSQDYEKNRVAFLCALGLHRRIREMNERL